MLCRFSRQLTRKTLPRDHYHCEQGQSVLGFTQHRERVRAGRAGEGRPCKLRYLTTASWNRSAKAGWVWSIALTTSTSIVTSPYMTCRVLVRDAVHDDKRPMNQVDVCCFTRIGE